MHMAALDRILTYLQTYTYSDMQKHLQVYVYVCMVCLDIFMYLYVCKQEPY